MDGISRRSFLKLCAAVPAVAAMPSLVFAETDEQLTPNVRHIGDARETIERDIRSGDYIVRYDVLCGDRHGDMAILDKQYCVNAILPTMDDLPTVKRECLDRLQSDMVRDGVDFSTVRAPKQERFGGTIRIRTPEAYKV